MDATDTTQRQIVNHIDLRNHNLNKYPDISLTTFLYVEYVHLKVSNGGDLYVTRHGLPFIDHIKPENWIDPSWFKTHREKMQGTSTVYKVRTKPVRGRNLEIIAKWSRVGLEVPLETKIIDDVLSAEFNSPFEEISLVEEFRFNDYGPKNIHIMLQKPLGIYVPPEKMQMWQTGRSKYKMRKKAIQHPGVEIDILRQYILIYKWVKGLDAVEAFEQAHIPSAKLESFTHRVTEELRVKGFRVLDQKPAHFIVRLKNDGTIMRNKKDDTLYALVDFELLERTPEHEKEIKVLRREAYLRKQRDRFIKDKNKQWPQHLHPVTIMGIDYVWGHTESTNGMLWVVGDDPDLFDYFQPERWRKTARTRLSHNSFIYYTRTKDNINIVWKVSRVGELPYIGHGEQKKKIVEHGFNSPFEKFSLALNLSSKGIATVYPRAIYMTGQSSDTSLIVDKSRFDSHRHIQNPERSPVLREDRNYVTIWGFFNGPDESLAEQDGEFYTAINSLNAFRRKLITEQEYRDLMQQTKKLLLKNNMEDLALKGNHILLSLNPKGDLVRRYDGKYAIWLCNFETMKKNNSAGQDKE